MMFDQALPYVWWARGDIQMARQAMLKLVKSRKAGKLLLKNIYLNQLHIALLKVR